MEMWIQCLVPQYRIFRCNVIVLPVTTWWVQKLGKDWQWVNKPHISLLGTYNLRKLNELEVRKHYQIQITNRFAALGNLSDDDDISRAWENIKENIKTLAKESLGLHKLKQHKPWFDEECLYFLDEMKQAKM